MNYSLRITIDKERNRNVNSHYIKFELNRTKEEARSVVTECGGQKPGDTDVSKINLS